MGCLKLDISKNYEPLLRVVGKISTTKKMDVDYYPFGSLMPNRYSGGNQYRYGMNGMEKDDEVTGVEGSSYTATFWQYDSRLGRRWNVDPVVKPYESSYATFSNNPVYFIDPNGDDPTVYENANDGEKIEINDGVDKTIKVNDTDFQEVKFFKNELDSDVPSPDGQASMIDLNVVNAYKTFFDNHYYMDGLSAENLYSYFTDKPFANIPESYVQGSAGSLEYIGGPASSATKKMIAKYGSKYTGKILSWGAIQKHHIIPKAIYKKYAAKLAPYMARDVGFNLKNLPTPFHGNHYYYNKYVGGKIEKLVSSGKLSESSLRTLNKNLTKEINKAYDSGLKLNDYFRYK